MVAARDVSVYLNNALKATHRVAELDSDLPENIREMPDQVTGHFVNLDSSVTQEMAAAWKRVIILNTTEVLYSFTLDPATGNFVAHKR
jgi:hypothetical protein